MLFRVTQDDINRSKQVKNGWCGFEITKVKEDKNKKDQSNQTIVDTRIIQGAQENIGIPIMMWFSEKAPGMVAPLAAAVAGVNLEDLNPGDIDLTPELVGQKFDGKVEVGDYNGKPTNNIKDYAPFGTFSSQSQ